MVNWAFHLTFGDLSSFKKEFQLAMYIEFVYSRIGSMAFHNYTQYYVEFKKMYRFAHTL